MPAEWPGRLAEAVADAYSPFDKCKECAQRSHEAPNLADSMCEESNTGKKGANVKFIVVAQLLLATAFLQSGNGAAGGGRDGTPPGAATEEATHVDREQVAGCAKASTLFSGPEFAVICYNRSTPGRAEAHAAHAHVWYIVEGEATLVTGGTMLQVQSEVPGEPRGTGIEGGHAQRLRKGDVIVIPAGMPHQYTQVLSPVAYYSVNVIKQKP